MNIIPAPPPVAVQRRRSLVAARVAKLKNCAPRKLRGPLIWRPAQVWHASAAAQDRGAPSCRDRSEATTPSQSSAPFRETEYVPAGTVADTLLVLCRMQTWVVRLWVKTRFRFLTLITLLHRSANVLSIHEPEYGLHLQTQFRDKGRRR